MNIQCFSSFLTRELAIGRKVSFVFESRTKERAVANSRSHQQQNVKKCREEVRPP